MSKIIIDIETVGFNFDSYDEKSREYLLKYAETDEEKEDVKKRLGLYPLTGEIVAIGMLNPESMRGCVLFQSKGEVIEPVEEDGIIFETGSEKDILSRFWDRIKSYDQVVTFNGRGFDAPYLLIRSAVHHLRPSVNLMGYRYDHRIHCDLLEQLTFYGVTRKYSLDFYAKSFGIRSSKEEGIDGSKVGELYKEGKCLEIAKYCLRDLLATKELYECWDKCIKF